MTIADQNTQDHYRQKIRAGFVAQGTSLRAWCLSNGIYPQNAHKALTGVWSGPKAMEVIKKLEIASGVSSK